MAMTIHPTFSYKILAKTQILASIPFREWPRPPHLVLFDVKPLSFRQGRRQDFKSTGAKNIPYEQQVYNVYFSFFVEFFVIVPSKCTRATAPVAPVLTMALHLDDEPKSSHSKLGKPQYCKLATHTYIIHINFLEMKFIVLEPIILLSHIMVL